MKKVQTTDRYDIVKSEVTSKTSAFAVEAKDKKKQVLDALSGFEEVDALKATGHKVMVKLTTKFREENKDLIAEWRTLRGEKNEKTLQEIFDKAQSEGITNLTKEEFKKAISGESEKKPEKKDSKESPLSDLQNKILSKPNMTDRHRQVLTNITNRLIEQKDEAGLIQLNDNINFTEKQGLSLKTSVGTLDFKPKQASFDDVKDINGIKEGSNIWTENKATKKKGLWASFEASKKMRESGKKLCSDEQYLAAANAFPGGDTLDKNNWSTKVKDFFDLLGVDQFGFRSPDGLWGDNFRFLWSSSVSGADSYHLNCGADEGKLDRDDEGYGLCVWFLED